MPSLRRFSGLLFGLLFLQLTVLGDSASCRSHGMGRTGATMSGMPMESAQHHGPPSSHDGCGAKRTASDCASMPSCATALGTPASAAALGQVAPVAQALPEPASIYSQPAAGPDVPPPRG